MNMNFSRTTDKIKQAAFYIPFTIYFVVFAIAAIIGFKMLDNDQINAYSSFANIFKLLLKVALGFTVAIILVAFIPVLISFVYFKYKQRKTGIRFDISTDVKESELHQKQTVRLLISPVLKPVFGFIKLRLLYDEKHYSKNSLCLRAAGESFSAQASKERIIGVCPK